MSETRYRIPKLAMAVMVFGGLGCDDEKSDSKNGADAGGVSEDRYTRVAQTQCKLEYTCPNLDPLNPELSEQQCVDKFVEDIKFALKNASKECVEAYLTYYECYASLGCDGDPVGCKTAADNAEAKCLNMLED